MGCLEIKSVLTKTMIRGAESYNSAGLKALVICSGCPCHGHVQYQVVACTVMLDTCMYLSCLLCFPPAPVGMHECFGHFAAVLLITPI